MKKGVVLFPRYKRGSHVGMILSFAIFITFIIFLYSVLNPAVKTGEDKTGTLDYIQLQILKNVSSNLTSATIAWSEEDNPSPKCVQLDNLLSFLEIITSEGMIIKNENNFIEDAYLVAESFPDLEIDRESKDNRFFRIYVSPEFNPLEINQISSCSRLSDYNIGSVTSGGYVFENEMYRLIEDYGNNYEGLRTDFKIPPGSEFGFAFIESDGTITNVGDPGKSTDVHVSETPIQYVDGDANILSGFINVKVW